MYMSLYYSSWTLSVRGSGDMKNSGISNSQSTPAHMSWSRSEHNYAISCSSSHTPSTNHTVSNRRGPGRTLDNLFSWAGTALEHKLGKVLYNAGVSPYARAEKDLAKLDSIAFISSVQVDALANKLLEYAGCVMTP